MSFYCSSQITGHYLKYYHNAPEEAGEDPGDIDAAFDLTQTSNCTYHGRRLDLKLGSHLLVRCDQLTLCTHI
jgi:hypothetical protein